MLWALLSCLHNVSMEDTVSQPEERSCSILYINAKYLPDIRIAVLLLFCAALTCTSVLVHYGLGRHADASTPANTLRNRTESNLAVVQLFISILLLRILRPHTKLSKLFLHVNMVLFKMTMVVAIILTFVQCDPPRALWWPVPSTKCSDPSTQARHAKFGGAYSAFFGFALPLLPLTIPRELGMSLRTKMTLAGLLGADVLHVKYMSQGFQIVDQCSCNRQSTSSCLQVPLQD